MMRRAALACCRTLLLPLWWWISLSRRRRRTSEDRRRVLLIAYNELTARYVSQYARLLADLSQVAVYATRAPLVDRSQSDAEVRSRIPARWISFPRAMTGWWDLVVVADHYPASLFHPDIPKVFVGHGLFAGRKFDDAAGYVYGRRSLISGKPVYRRMFAAGESERQTATRINPALADTIAVVGDPRCDDLLDGDLHREAFRRRLGIDPADTAVLLMSSWGPDSLIQSRGEALIKQAERLSHRYRFLLTIHPNNLSRRGQRADRWRALVARCRRNGWIVATPREDWTAYLASADLFVTDFTSLGLYASLLERPIVMTTFDDRMFPPESPISRLRRLTVPLDRPRDLDRCLRAAAERFDPEPLRRFNEELIVPRGVARRRCLDELSRLLDGMGQEEGWNRRKGRKRRDLITSFSRLPPVHSSLEHAKS